MSSDDLMRAMNNIEDSLIAEADPSVKHFPAAKSIRRWAMLAAAFLVVLGLGTFGISHLSGAGANIRGSASSAESAAAMEENGSDAASDEVMLSTFAYDESAEEGEPMDESAVPMLGASMDTDAASDEDAMTDMDSAAAPESSSSAEAPEMPDESELLTIPVYWNGAAYLPEEGVLETIDESRFSFSFAVSADASEPVWCEDSRLETLPVFTCTNDVSVFYIAFPDGYRLYRLAE